MADVSSPSPKERGYAVPSDIAHRNYKNDIGNPGEFPYTRGNPVHAGASKQNASKAAWELRELSGEGNAKRSNEQLRFLVQAGAKGLDVIGDAPTMGGMDPDHPYSKHAVGTQGVSVCRLQDFRDLYDGLPLETLTFSNSLLSPFTVAGLYCIAKERNVDPAIVRGSTIFAPSYAEDYAYAIHLPYEARMRIHLDGLEFSSRHMPKFHAFIEDTYFFSDGGVGPIEEMALGFLEIREVARRMIERGVEIDSFAPRIAILVNCRMDVLTEVAKVRATRRIFARMMRDEFGAKDPRSWRANIAVHTSGASLTAQQPVNNVIRGSYQAMAMALVGVKAMEVSAFDEALRTPSEAAHMVGLRTQQILALETDVTHVADPFGGSYFMEHRTDEMEAEILGLVKKIEALGTMADLSNRGYFREMLTNAMVTKGKETNDGIRPVVGLNCYKIPDEEDTMLREHTNKKINPDYQHIEDIKRWKLARDMTKVQKALDDIQGTMSDPNKNLMPFIISGYEADATIGEMMSAIRVAIGMSADPLMKATIGKGA